MSTFTVFGLMMLVVCWAVVLVMALGLVITVTVKDMLEERRRAKAARTGFPWAWDK